MTTENENPRVQLVEIKGNECVKFTFKGHFTEEDAKYGVGEWNDFFKSAGTEKVTVIWDAVQMTGFDNNARVVWQKAIKEFKKQIDCIWLIADSKIIRAGAKAMSLFTSFCLKAVKTEDEIKFK